MQKIKVAPVGVDDRARGVFSTANGQYWKTAEQVNLDPFTTWETLTELYDADEFDGEPGSPRPVEDFELVREEVLWHLMF